MQGYPADCFRSTCLSRPETPYIHSIITADDKKIDALMFSQRSKKLLDMDAGFNGGST